MTKPRVIAFYLPQFHPIPENNEWWGKGFTEWTNVARAKKYYFGHYQPRIPGELGFYDLRVPEVRERQAELARDAGIEGFCYWHYWFDEDKQLLERPFNEVLQSGKPDYPFCLAWANESWFAKSWDKNGSDKLLIEQTYKGEKQYIKHFYDVLPAFKDKRYIKVDGKPVFIIYKPLANNEITVFIKVWRNLAKENGFPDIYFIGHCISDRKNIKKYYQLDLDSINMCSITDFMQKRSVFIRGISRLWTRIFKRPYIFSYSRASKGFFNKEMDSNTKICPSIITGWDHTPRSGSKGVIFKNETPINFGQHVRNVVENSKGEFIFIKSWNEWAEGNYLEPDLRYGDAYLKVLGDIIKNNN